MRKAAEPMMGGIIMPPVEATASTEPAKAGSNPFLIIRGMVKAPVVATFAAEDPLMVPIRPLEMMETLAGPPGRLPAIFIAQSVKRAETPLALSSPPKRMKRKT